MREASARRIPDLLLYRTEGETPRRVAPLHQIQQHQKRNPPVETVPVEDLAFANVRRVCGHHRRIVEELFLRRQLLDLSPLCPFPARLVRMLGVTASGVVEMPSSRGETRRGFGEGETRADYTRYLD